MRRIVLSSVLPLALVACGPSDGDTFGPVPAVREPAHLRFCNSGEPESLDPAIASTTVAMPLVYAMFDGLTTYDDAGLPRPSLATSWDITPDLRTYTFHLRDDAHWSNGRGVTAYDVAYQILRVLHPITASPNGDNLQTVKNAMAFLGRRVAVLTRALPPYAAGDVVEIVRAAGKKTEDYGDDPLPNPNRRVAATALRLRDLGAAERAGYQTVAAGRTVEIIEQTGGRASPPSPDGQPWAYVYYETGDGVYGWVPTAQLAAGDQDATAFVVRGVAEKNRPGATGTGADPGPEVAATGRDLLVAIDAIGMTVPDPYTIVFENADPTPFFISLTNNRAMRTTPREAVSRWPRHWDQPEHIVTNGPMRLTAWKQRDYVEMVRWRGYWNDAESKLETFTAYAIDDQAAAVNYYYTGGCDATTSNQIPASYLPAMNGERGKRLSDFHIDPYLGIYFAYVNTKVFRNVHLRRALAYAVNRQPIPRFTHGGEMPTAQLTPGTPISTLSDADLALCGVTRDQPGFAMIEQAGKVCYVPPPGLDYDPAKAKAELALARQEMGSAFPSKLTYRYNAGSEAHKLIAEYLQSQWQAIGLSIDLESQDWNTFVSDTRAGKYELARFGNIGNFPDPEAEFLANFRCKSPDNRAQWCDDEFEQLMEAARPLADRAARNAKIREAEARLLDQVPVIPLYVYTQKRLMRPYVRGLSINLIDQPPIAKVWLDPDWTQAAP